MKLIAPTIRATLPFPQVLRYHFRSFQATASESGEFTGEAHAIGVALLATLRTKCGENSVPVSYLLRSPCLARQCEGIAA